MKIPNIFKKHVYKTNAKAYIIFAILVELLIFTIIAWLGDYCNEHGMKALGTIIVQCWYFLLGTPFFFLKKYKENIAKEHATKKIQYEFEHLNDGAIGVKGINQVSFEKIDKIEINKQG